jgi:hypothetical protein
MMGVLLSWVFTTLASGADGPVLLDAKLAKRDTLRATEEYCSKASLGTVPGPRALARLDGAELDVARREVGNARNLFRSLGTLIPLCADGHMTRDDTIAVMQQLVLLRRKVQSPEHIGVGNLEVSNALSITVAGLFFQVYDPNRESDHKALSAVLSARDRSHDDACLVWALRNEGLVDETGATRATYDLLIELAGARGDQVGTRSPELDGMLRKLGKSEMRVSGSFQNQLNSFDRTWFTWDVLNATRLLAACKLCLRAEGEKKSGQGVAPDERLEKAISSLDDFERKTLWAVFPAGGSEINRNVSVALHLKRLVSSKGRDLLESVHVRLQGEAKEPTK